MAETGRVLRISRWFDASPERVFDAWITPETVRRWLFASPADEEYRAELEPRVGGAWTITARREGIDYTAIGEYLEIDRPRRLVFTFGMPQFTPNYDRLTIEISPEGAGCRLTLTQEGIDIAAELAHVPPDAEGGTAQGWQQMFDLLAAIVAGGEATGSRGQARG